MSRVLMALAVLLVMVSGGCQQNPPSGNAAPVDTIQWTGADSGYKAETKHYADGQVERRTPGK